MRQDLSNLRKNYTKSELLEKNIPLNPLNLFKDWFEQIKKVDDKTEVNAMTLSTISKDSFPRSRIVLLKEYNDFGFIFYSNYDSEKSKSILLNNKVSISFFWESLERQVLIKGYAKRTSKLVSDTYFNSRPRGSKIGALVSNQSSIIKNRDEIEKKLKDFQFLYKNKKINRPENWGGFIINPIEYEFWQGRDNRLHDRIRFKSEDNKWKIDRLSP